MGLFLCLVCNLGAIRGRFRQVFWFGVVRGVVTTNKRKEGGGGLQTNESHKSLSYHKAMQRIAIETPYS